MEVQVVINGHKESSSSIKPKPRLLSVDEALKYSPLTSSTSTFGLDCFPFPQLAQKSSPPTFITPSQRQSLHESLAPKIASRDDPTTSTSQQYVVQQVHGILENTSLTEYTFKAPQLVSRKIGDVSPSTQQSAFLQQMSPIAREILNRTQVPFHYATHITPDSDFTTPSRPVTHIQVSPNPIPNLASYQIHKNDATVTPKRPSFSSEPTKTPMVLVPNLPAASQHEYIAITESSKQEKPYSSAANHPLMRARKDEIEASLIQLQDLLGEIFEAEDQLEPDTSYAAPSTSNAFFEPLPAFDLRHDLLSTRAHSSLQKALKKMVSFSDLNQIPDDYVSRLQKLCELSIFALRDLDVKVEPGDVQAWESSLHAVENGLSSSCTFLWTILGSITKKELCPEDIVQCLPVILESTLEKCIIPVVEARPNGKDSEIFRAAVAVKGILNRIAGQSKKLLELMTRICLEMDSLGLVVIKLEMLSSKLIFIENAHSEKDSALGFQVFEGIRKTAMDALARLFSRFKDDRTDILAQLSQNLEKLPTTNKSARQYKLNDGKNIQLLSALLILLVQATSLEEPQNVKKSLKRPAKAPSRLEEGSEDESMDSDGDETEELQQAASRSPLESLCKRVESLQENSIQSAHNIIKFFLDKATMPKSTKSGEEPYRNLLDLFVEDLLSVVSSPDWPGSELLLRILTMHLFRYLNNDKSGANVKNMALEHLGWIGSTISHLRGTVSNLQQSKVENEDSEIAQHLRGLVEDQLHGGLRLDDIVIQDGPFRVAAEYLQDRNVDNFQLVSARQYYLLQWGQAVRLCFAGDGEGFSQLDADSLQLVLFVHKALTEPNHLEKNSDFDGVSTTQGRLAYLLTLLNSDLCKAFDKIVKYLLASISSDQAKTRSRSLKSVTTMLETDPKLLNREPAIMRVIFNCTADSSPMVRDSALSLIGKCITLKPDLEDQGCQVFLKSLADATPGVRKRCMAVLKEIYQRSNNPEMRSQIAQALLRSVKDHEESISSLARQSIEEIWFGDIPSKTSSNDDSARHKVAISQRTSLIIATLQHDDETLPFFEAFLKPFLSETSKAAAANFDICKSIVADVFLRVVNSSSDADQQTRVALLRTLTAFAKTKPRLITPDQLENLQPYIDNVATADDLLLFKFVVVIYRCTLPFLSAAQKPMLEAIENQLFKSVSRLAKPELSEVMACLWTINGVLQHTYRIVRMVVSALGGSQRLKAIVLPESPSDLTDSQKTDVSRVKTYLRIIGCVGKHCDLEDQPDFFKKSFPSWQDGSVAGLMADTVCPFTSADRPAWLRGPALESLGFISQSWPAQFNKAHIRSSFYAVLDGQDADLQDNVMTTLAEFFHIREDATEVFSTQEDQSQEQELGRLGGSLKASDHDSAASLIAQHFLQKVLGIATSRTDKCGLRAIKVIASINRQGLVHPKESAATLVAVETSPITEMAKVAYESHKLLHHQHESMFEREYMRAIYGAFKYQKDVIGESAGAWTKPFAPKLGSLFELVKTSNAKYVRKFLGNLIARVDFDLSKLDMSIHPPEHLFYARFLTQNLAYFEFGRVDELLVTISCIERIMGKTGADVAQAIDTQVLGVTTAAATIVDGDPSNCLPTAPEKEENSEIANHHIASPETNKRLTVAAMILSMLWEVRLHLRRQYHLDPELRFREGKLKDSKELAKTPTKVNGITGDKFWDTVSAIMSSLDTPENMLERCASFAELMKIDDEVRVAAADDEMRESFSASLELDDEAPMMDGEKSKGSKRKMPASAGSTPKKKRGRPSLKDQRRKSAVDMDSDGGAWE
ncbi:MAG: hypothetical protein Q9227_002685 [Pyrenula ochraceoflavens]